MICGGQKRENFPEIHLLKNLVICRMLITINYINLNWDVMFKNIYLHYYLLLPQHRFSLFEAHNVIPNTVREQLEMGSWIPKHNTSKSYVLFNYIVYFYPLSHDFFFVTYFRLMTELVWSRISFTLVLLYILNRMW